MRPIDHLTARGDTVVVAVVLNEWQQMTGDTHYSPRSVCNLKKVEVARARQDHRWLKCRITDVATVLQESSIVWMEPDAKALLRGGDLRVCWRSDWEIFERDFVHMRYETERSPSPGPT